VLARYLADALAGVYHSGMADHPAVVLSDLRKTYRDGWFGGRVEALKGVSFDVEPGQVFGLLGPNGAGKTTIIKILLGVVQKTHGHASLFGRPAGSRGGRKRVGYLPENLRIPSHHTAGTALAFYGRLSGMAESDIHRRRDELLELTGIAEWRKVGVKKYSKGMRQRLGLAQALLHDPDLLILDEPTDGLDPVGRRDVRDLLEKLRGEGKTIFLNSHLLQEVEMVCDRVAILDRGELRYVGAVDEITRDKPAERFEVQFELEGEAQALNGILQAVEETAAMNESVNKRNVQRRGDRRAVIELAVENQTDVDRLVDQFRATGVSIVGLSRRRTTLESAFIEMLRGGGGVAGASGALPPRGSGPPLTPPASPPPASPPPASPSPTSPT